MIPSNRVQAVIHHSQSVDGTFCVHVLFAGPDIHDGVITIQPWHILSIVHTPCERQTHRSQGSASRDGFVKKNREMACLKYIFSHCALLLHGLPEAEAKRTHSATRWCPSCSTPHWTGSRFHSSRQSRINACPSGMRRNWLFYKEGTALSVNLWKSLLQWVRDTRSARGSGEGLQRGLQTFDHYWSAFWIQEPTE